MKFKIMFILALSIFAKNLNAKGTCPISIEKLVKSANITEGHLENKCDGYCIEGTPFVSYKKKGDSTSWLNEKDKKLIRWCACYCGLKAPIIRQYAEYMGKKSQNAASKFEKASAVFKAAADDLKPQLDITNLSDFKL